MMKTQIAHGQLIKLKTDATEPYLILHKNVFPAVLNRIARSNISNYSIYLHDGLLFGYYEYLGNDYKADMGAMAEDNSTQQWWKLTAPLQEPLDERGEGEWWTELTLLLQYQNDHSESNSLNRISYLIPTEDAKADTEALKVQLNEDDSLKKGLYKMLLFQAQGKFLCYTEIDDKNTEDVLIEFLDKLPGRSGKIIKMNQVFHTPGKSVKDIRKKVFVTGCFDMLHSGHVEFLHEASSFGDLYVCIGSDVNINKLKGRPPVNLQEERKYMLSAVRHVYKCGINQGWGVMDFLAEIEDINPDIFIVNEDGNTMAKAALCEKLGIEYKVLKRLPHDGLPARSTTALRSECRIPYRIDLAGGWLDQPFVSRHSPGPVLTISLEPTLEFNHRSGMASSTRKKAIELWQTDIPPGNPEQLARVLFSFDNPPGTKEVSGSQDALGIVLPGLNKLSYNGNYWPEKITSVNQEEILAWIEDHLCLINLGPRHDHYQVVEHTSIDTEKAKKLSIAAENCWNAILAKDARLFGAAFRAAFEAQVAMFPNMVDENIRKIIALYQNQAYGWKLSGAGGGGYLILVTEEPVEGSMRIKIRRREVL